MSLGENISKLRKKSQYSQEQLGDCVNVTRQTISNWELNVTLPDANQLIALSKALQISIDALVDNDIQNLLEQKVKKVETDIEMNCKLSKITIMLTIIIAGLVLAFIMSN